MNTQTHHNTQPTHNTQNKHATNTTNTRNTNTQHQTQKGVLNALLARDTAARRRAVALRTYSVIPLADDCGILQWVDNLVPFKVMTRGG